MKIILKNIPNQNQLSFEMPSSGYKVKLDSILADAWKKNNGYVCLTVEKVRKPRTTGEGSQNNLFYALVTEIAKETGNDIEDVKDAVKERAIKRGYPYAVNPISGKIKPYSTTKVDTVQMSYLIDECYQLCAELGIQLPPTEVKK